MKEAPSASVSGRGGGVFEVPLAHCDNSARIVNWMPESVVSGDLHFLRAGPFFCPVSLAILSRICAFLCVFIGVFLGFYADKTGALIRINGTVCADERGAPVRINGERTSG